MTRRRKLHPSSDEKAGHVLRDVVCGMLSGLLTQVAFGCAKEEPRANAPVSAPAFEPQQGPAPGLAASAEMHVHMAQHYTQALRMRRAVVVADLKNFKEAAAFIAQRDIEPGAPAEWKPYVDAMRNATAQAVHSEDVTAAAEALGQLGAKCADCHLAMGSPKLTLGESPPRGAEVAHHMARHDWAAARMWDGLISPSARLWVKGAEAMAEARLIADDVAPETPDIDQLARRVHYQANTARLLARNEWAHAYAEFLVTCSSCHQKVGFQPRE